MIKQLRDIGQNGINLDVDRFKLPIGTISQGKNFRVLGMAIESVCANNRITQNTIADSGKVFPVRTPDNTYIMVLGRNGVVVYDGATLYNISPSGGVSDIGSFDEYKWTTTMLGQIPIVNNFLNTVYFWSPQSVSSLLQPLMFDATDSWLAKGYSAKVFKSHGTFLFALNLQEGVNELPDWFRWSHPADTDALPFTWDETDLSAIAGKASLGGDGGYIVTGLSLRENFVIYSKKAINVLSRSGDDQIWTRRQISSSVGAASQDAVVEVDGKHYFIAVGDFMVTDGISIQSIAHNRVKRALQENASEEYYIYSYAISVYSKNEVWFCVSENNAVLPNTAYVYNWKVDAWSIRRFDGTIGHSNYGSKTSPLIRFNSYDGSDPPMTFRKFGYKYSYEKFAKDDVIGVTPSGELLLMDDNSSTNNLDCYIEGINIDLDAAPSELSVTRLYPYMEGSDVSIQVGSQDILGGPVQWREPISFDPETQKTIDTRVSGLLFAYRISSNTNKKWRFSGMDIEYQVEGLR